MVGAKPRQYDRVDVIEVDGCWGNGGTVRGSLSSWLNIPR